MEMTKQQQQARAISYVLIQRSEIDDDFRFNCRGKITPMDVEALAQDISKNGLLQPIVVRPKANGNFKYRVVAGFSRFMAMRVLRWQEIPSVIRECDDETASFFNLSENLIRKNLNFMQEAKQIQDIVCRYPHLSLQMIGERLGQNRGWVEVRLFALQLCPEIQDVISRGFVTQDQIRAVYKMPTKEHQLTAIRKIKEARERGLKVQIKQPKNKQALIMEPRTRTEMFAMIEHIKEGLKTYNFGTRCLAWAAGEISDFELFGDIENIAIHEEIPYKKPKKLDMRSEIEKLKGDPLE